MGSQVFASNGNVLMGYELELPEIYSQSEKDFEDLHSMWFQALKALPSRTIVHKQDIYCKKTFKAHDLPSSTFLARATANYFEGRSFIEHKSYLYFLWPFNKAQQTQKYSNPFVQVEKGIVKKVDQPLEQFVGSVKDAVNYLQNSKKIQIKALSEEQFTEQTYQYFNGFNEDFDTDVLLDKKSIQIGDNFFDVMAINHEQCFGEEFHSSRPNHKFTTDEFIFHGGLIDELGLSLKENHIVNQILYLDDTQQWRRQLDKKIEELKKSTNFGTQNKIVLQQIEKIVGQIHEDDQSRICRGHLNVVFWTESETGLAPIATQIKTAFKELDMVPYYPNGEERKHYFLNSYPCFASNFSNEDLYVADLKHALCLWINNSSYQSDEKGVLFNDRVFNIPVYKDLWDEQKKRIKARNFAIFAPTGEGKSFLANNIIRQYFESEVRMVIIDLGGSYAKFAKLYPEDHILLRYEEGKNLGINPFYISRADDVKPERLEDLATFLFELMASPTAITKAQEVSLKKILKHYYNEIKENHSLENLCKFIEERKDRLFKDLRIHCEHFDLPNFLHILSEYTEDGLYSFLFEVNEDQTYKIDDKKLIIFELDEIKDNKEILSVMLKLIKSAIQRTIWRNKQERGIILFDEFAKQLKFDHVLESVEFYYQAIRKQNGAIGIILQSINQLPNNSTSASILENTQVIYSLNNEKGYQALHKRLNLTQHDLNQLKSIKNNLVGEHKYTEIFIKIGKHSNVFRLEVPKEVYAAYLTDGKEHQQILDLFSENQDMEKAIQLFIAEP